MTDRLLGQDGEDPGCDECLDRLHAWADAVAAGAASEAADPLVAKHLRDCADCREDAEGLFALIAPADEPL